MSGMISRVAAFGACLLLTASAMADAIAVGQIAPAFRLPDQAGKMHRLSDYRGQWVVLYFYPKDDTPGCTTEACSFRDNISAISAKGAVVLGISVDNSDSHAEFADKYHLPFPLLADKGGKIAQQYGSLLNLIVIKVAKRHSFIIDPKGRIAKIYRDVSPASHVTEIVKALEELQGRSE